MARGGKRAGAGRPKVERSTTPSLAARLLAEIKIEQKWKRLIEIKTELAEEKQRTEPLRTTLKYLECRAYGNPTDTVNHLQDKPIDLTVTHTLSERMMLALARANERARNR